MAEMHSAEKGQQLVWGVQGTMVEDESTGFAVTGQAQSQPPTPQDLRESALYSEISSDSIVGLSQAGARQAFEPQTAAQEMARTSKSGQPHHTLGSLQPQPSGLFGAWPSATEYPFAWGAHHQQLDQLHGSSNGLPSDRAISGPASPTSSQPPAKTRRLSASITVSPVPTSTARATTDTREHHRRPAITTTQAHAELGVLELLDIVAARLQHTQAQSALLSSSSSSASLLPSPLPSTLPSSLSPDPFLSSSTFHPVDNSTGDRGQSLHSFFPQQLAQTATISLSTPLQPSPAVGVSGHGSVGLANGTPGVNGHSQLHTPHQHPPHTPVPVPTPTPSSARMAPPGPGELGTLGPPPEGIYRTFEDLLTAVQRVAKDQGYGVVKLRASNYRDGKPTRYDLVCDRGGVKYNSTAKKRNPSTRKVDCPWRAKAVCEVQLGNQWRFAVQDSRHNHEARVPAAPPGQENTPLAQSIRSLTNKLDRIGHDMTQGIGRIEARLETLDKRLADIEQRVNNVDARMSGMEVRDPGMQVPLDNMEMEGSMLGTAVM